MDFSNLTAERDDENDCWILVDTNPDTGEDRRVVAAFFEDGPEPPKLLNWIIEQAKIRRAA